MGDGGLRLEKVDALHDMDFQAVQRRQLDDVHLLEVELGCRAT